MFFSIDSFELDVLLHIAETSSFDLNDVSMQS